jgi:hypothetical protein
MATKKAIPKKNDSDMVNEFMNKLVHPLKAEIEAGKSNHQVEQKDFRTHQMECTKLLL